MTLLRSSILAVFLLGNLAAYAENMPNLENKSNQSSKKTPAAATKVLDKTNTPSSKVEKNIPKNQTTDKKTAPAVEQNKTKTSPANNTQPEKSAKPSDSVYHLNFTSPSKNIVCGGDVLAEYGGAQGVSCYLKQMDNAPLLEKPKSCTENWGQVFELGKSGKANLACYDDTPYAEQPEILPYGKTMRGKGWYCTSLPTGMKCVNYQNSGFEIGRQKQVFF